VVIDQRVHVVVADPPGEGLGGVRRGPAVGAPAAAVGDLADLLDVDVDQLAGAILLVAQSGRLGRAVRAGIPTSGPSQSWPRRVSSGRPRSEPRPRPPCVG